RSRPGSIRRVTLLAGIERLYRRPAGVREEPAVEEEVERPRAVRDRNRLRLAEREENGPLQAHLAAPVRHFRRRAAHGRMGRGLLRPLHAPGGRAVGGEAARPLLVSGDLIQLLVAGATLLAGKKHLLSLPRAGEGDRPPKRPRPTGGCRGRRVQGAAARRFA